MIIIIILIIIIISGDGSRPDRRPPWPEFPAQPSLPPVFPPAASASSPVLLLPLGRLQQLPGLQQEDPQM